MVINMMVNENIKVSNFCFLLDLQDAILFPTQYFSCSVV